ncbi:MAG: hypothetical protein ACREPI_06195 [Candidatus Dormibacterales bacterium]
MGDADRDTERRAALRSTDDLLEILEVLNLKDARQAPRAVLEALARLGVPDPGGHTIAELISIVLDRQRRYLRAGGAGAERRMPSGSTPAGAPTDRRR